jgi:aryl-alcohol dehydrogenase-like predicted oxidoreductase
MRELIFGCLTIGKWHWSDVNDSVSKNALTKAFDLGITKFDTAPVYGFGHAEKILAETFKGVRDKIFIMTKCGLDWESKQNQFFFDTVFNGKLYSVYRNLSPERIKFECEMSLKRLNTDYIDLYQMHWKDTTVPILEVAESLELLKKEGKIREWGVCNINTGDLDLLVKNNLKPYSLQFKYSLLHRKPEKSVIPYCKKHKIKLFGYSPFEQGLLVSAVFKNRKLENEDGRIWWSKEKLEQAEIFKLNMEKLCHKYNTTTSALILFATFSVSCTDGLITGMRTPKHVEDNFKFQHITLNDKDLGFICQSAVNLSN